MRHLVPSEKKFETVILSLLFGWLSAYLISGSFVHSYTLEYTYVSDLPLRIIMILIFSIIFYLLSCWKFHPSRLIFLGLVFIFISLTLLRDTDSWTQIAFTVLGLFTLWFIRDSILVVVNEFYKKFPSISTKLYFVIAFFLFVLIAWVGIMRYLNFRSADFDLGLFSQMFESMKDTGRQLTTVERDTLMSHFKVHISPALYLFLPFYYIFPSPITLQVVQAILIALSIWPLYLLCKTYHLKSWTTFIVISLYALFPALAGSCFNDFHENCLLPLFLFFLIWAYENDKIKLTILFTILTLLIKEDSAILVAFLSLYYFISQKKRKLAAGLLALSILYFLSAITLLSSYGNGVLGYMTNFTIEGKSGMVQMVLSLILNPAYSLLQCLQVPEKLYYLLFLVLPLNTILFVNKKYVRMIILFPFILMNLMPNYDALYTLQYQYHFGITVFLFYILVQNISEISSERVKVWALYSLFAVMILFVPTSLKTAIKCGITFYSEHETNDQIRTMLDQIPASASINISPKLLPYLYDHKEVYPITSLLTTDYVIFDQRKEMMMYEDEIFEKYYSEGYELIAQIDQVMKIYKKLDS